MRRTLTTSVAALLLLSATVGTAAADHDPTEPLEQHCPGATDDDSAVFVPVPEGYEIVLSNDDTEDGGTLGLEEADRNTTVLDAGTLVCIKGGPSATGIIVADGTSNLRQLLGHYVTVGTGNVPDVSYYMTYRPVEVEQGQWCSPGFWRNSPIQAAATAEHADLSFLPYGVTYKMVLDSPQTYGGELFNQVGDALSAAHPDVDFTGDRVEDSCPLSSDNALYGPPKRR